MRGGQVRGGEGEEPRATEQQAGHTETPHMLCRD